MCKRLLKPQNFKSEQLFSWWDIRNLIIYVFSLESGGVNDGGTSTWKQFDDTFHSKDIRVGGSLTVSSNSCVNML